MAATGFFLLARGLVLLWRRCWLPGGLHLLAFPIVEFVALAGVPLAIIALIGADTMPAATADLAIDPSQKARILGETISEVMNASAWLVLPAILAGFILRPPQRQT